MKCTIPEISWHNREPVLSVDLHPDFNTTSYKLATAGGDCHVLIWKVTIDDDEGVKQELISDLKRHQRSVNVVKWSPSGVHLASGDDDANIIIWVLKTDNIPSLDDDNNDKEKWNVYKILRGHKEDIYDLCWSPNSLKLLSGSIDNTAILWDLEKGSIEQILKDHKGFVQGVAWDPKNQYIVTITTDRVCRIYDSSGKYVRARIAKGPLPVSTTHQLFQKEVKYFYDDTFKSFFRRLCFSPDGAIFIAPSGHIVPDEGKPLNCTYIFATEVNTPVAILPAPKQCSTVVKCCPIFFQLREDGPEPYINLPYRILFAIGTDHDVILYDTQQLAPFATFHNIHYTRLTDLTWSNDGLLLIASSTDGFCTMITFEEDELGVHYVKEDSEVEDTMNVSIVSETVEIPDSPKVKEKENSDKQATPTPKKPRKSLNVEKNKSILSFFKKVDEPIESISIEDDEKSKSDENLKKPDEKIEKKEDGEKLVKEPELPKVVSIKKDENEQVQKKPRRIAPTRVL